MQRNCTFPLAMAAMHYHNHPDFMVRTSVMNIVLELMKSNPAGIQFRNPRRSFTSVDFPSPPTWLPSPVKLADSLHRFTLS